MPRADQRSGAQILAHPEVSGRGILGEGKQPLCFLGHDGEVEETPGQEQPKHR
jgi:hypothetical protein